MQIDHTKTIRHLNFFYFILFFGIGGFMPLLSVYFSDELQFSGTQIGTVMSMGPIIMLLTQPVWGLVCDYTRKPKRILVLVLLISSILLIPYLWAHQYFIVLVLASVFSIFQGAITPIADSLTVSYTHKMKADYGKVRLWGAIGFAVAAFVMGQIADWTAPSAIFYGMIASFVIAIFLVKKIPEEDGVVAVNIRSGVRKLITYPKFTMFVLAMFLVFGPVSGNNVYFGILIHELGGTLAGVGLAFFLAAGLEAPFMRLSGRWVKKWGSIAVISIAGLVSALRWLFYFTAPDTLWIYISTIAQGFSVGLLIPVALGYVKKIAPKEVTVTAISLYSAIGNGLGNWFCVLIGGIILDHFHIFGVYLFFAILTSIGLILLFFVFLLERKEKAVQPD